VQSPLGRATTWGAWHGGLGAFINTGSTSECSVSYDVAFRPKPESFNSKLSTLIPNS